MSVKRHITTHTTSFHILINKSFFHAFRFYIKNIISPISRLKYRFMYSNKNIYSIYSHYQFFNSFSLLYVSLSYIFIYVQNPTVFFLMFNITFFLRFLFLWMSGLDNNNMLQKSDKRWRCTDSTVTNVI